MADLVYTTNGITRLNKHNYQRWQSHLKSYLEGQDLWEVVNGNDTKPPEDDYTLRKWKVKVGKVMYVLKSTVEDELLRQIKDDSTPKMAWDTFASLFPNTNDAQLQYGVVARNRARMLHPKLYKAAKEGDVSCLSGICLRNRTEGEAMDNYYHIFLKRTQRGKNNMLHIAARAGRDIFIAEVLWRFPFLADQVNSQGDTPLLVAARFGHLEVVDELTKSATENGTNLSSRRRPRGEGEEQVTRQVGMAPIAENETNPSSSHPQSAAKKDRVDYPLEEGNRPVRKVYLSNSNSIPSSSRSSIGEEGGDHQLEQVTGQVGMAPAAENETNPSRSHPQSGAEEDRVDHPLEEGNRPVRKVYLSNSESIPSSSRSSIGEERGDHQLEQVTGQVGMAPAAENETNPSRSHPQSGAEEDRVDHPLEAGNTEDIEWLSNSNEICSSRSSIGDGIGDHQSEGTIPNSIVINIATDMEEGEVHLELDELIPYHWLVTNEQGTTVTTALHEALRNGHEDVAQFLLKLIPEIAGFDNLAGESPLFLAAESRCESFMTDILLSKQPYSTKGPDGLNALHAARDCCGAIISLLIKQKPDLMRQLDNRGKAAIHHAVEADYWVLTSRMLMADASIALFPDADGYTALLTASRRGCWKICKYILEICPESIEARDHKGRNALHLCSIMNYGSRFVKIPEIWELLNERDDEGNTPLHVAVKENHYEKAMLLTSSVSIDLGAVNNEGLTALDLCESDWMHFNKKRLMWFHLWRHGAPRGRCPNEHKVPVGGPKEVIRSPDEDTKPYINTMSVVAALIATLTFAAAFTMPGGYDSSPDNLGGATLVKKAALKAFILSDTLAMCCSITVVSLLWRAMRVEQDLKFVLTNASVILLHIALLATLVAFMSGIFAVIAPKALWIAILVCIVCTMVFCLLTPERVQRSSLSTWFTPNIITRDILRFIQLKQGRNKRKRDQHNVESRIQKRSPDTNCVSNTTNVNEGSMNEGGMNEVNEGSMVMSPEIDLAPSVPFFPDLAGDLAGLFSVHA